MITVYTPGQDNDMPLFSWYMELWRAEDMQKLLGPSLWPLAAFMRHFTDPTASLFYLADEQGWWIAAWLFPMAGGGSWGLWVRKDMRDSANREGVNLIMETLAAGLERWPVLVNTTTQLDIIGKTEKLGYTYMGSIPHLFEGQDCYLLYMTRAQFAPKLEAWRRYYGRRQNRDGRA